MPLFQKFSRLDIKLEVDDKIVNIEMQVNSESDFKDRTLFYWSKLYSEELKTGEEYGVLKQTICINIIDFKLFDCDNYHSSFKILENTRHELLTDKFGIHFFELKKVNKYKQNKRMEDWLNLINAETEDDLMAIQNTTTIPEVKQTIVMLRELSADEKVRTEAYYREKRLHDEASAINSAKREGIAEGLAQGLEQGREEGLAKGRADGINEIIEKMRRSGMTDEQINLILGVPV
jgi:predicted transposase/invertase (TIGR01784 family)